MRFTPALHTVLPSILMLLFMASGLKAQQVVMDNDEGPPVFTTTGSWLLSGTPGYEGGTYIFTTSVNPANTATWQKTVPQPGLYEVFAAFLRSTNRPTVVPYVITHGSGTAEVSISQQGSLLMVEESLGVFPFGTDQPASVQLIANGTSGAYIADAIILRRVSTNEPVITAVEIIPDPPVPGMPIRFEATIESDSPVTEVELDWGIGTLTNTMSASLVGDSTWARTIAPQPAGANVHYRFRATNEAELTTETDIVITQVFDSSEYRVLWADSWNASFLNQSQAQDLVNTARANNINTLMPQVRKVGDALYDSAYEPRATNISGGASFDPLGYLLNLAHDTSGGQKRVAVHAWFVMHRIATKSQTLHPQHPLSLHPEWEMFARTNTQPPYEPVGGTQRYLDPGHPDVIDYNIAVILDCMQKYNIDGVNLDYIRYPEPADGKVHGYNPVSIARFNAVHNRTGIPVDSDPLWRDWRRANVTLAVKKLYVQMWKEDPSVILTADTINWGTNYSTTNFHNSAAYNNVFQDWKGWLEDGILDYNALMNYVAQSTPTVPSRYQGWTNLSLQVDGLRGSIIGIGAYLHTDPAFSAAQLLYARQQGAAGLNIYDWGSEVQSASGFTRAQFYNTIRTEVFPEWVDPPAAQWKVNPVTGIVEGHVYDGLIAVDHAQVEVVGMPHTATMTDGKGWFGILHLPPGSHTLRVQIPGKPEILFSTQPLSAGDVQTVVIGDSEVRDIWGIF